MLRGKTASPAMARRAGTKDEDVCESEAQ